ncbi:5-formyltetrahydrofolate cyclo-ligase [Kaarinaea lacus]
MNSRQLLRKRMREQRRSLSAHERKRFSKLLAKRFAKTALFRNSKHIAFYIANDGELDLLPLMKIAWRLNKRCYLPILSPPFRRHLLYFARYNEGDALIANQYAIPEPKVSPRQWCTGRRLNLVLTPLVAFDTNGNRLGMGGGYYDRTFSYLRNHRRWRRPRLVGIAYDFQQVDQLENASWDVPLSAIVTPEKMIVRKK